ncbi:MAG: HAD family hydrolase [Pseudomonadota bacterium]|nr:HAD family hydrolase [Pseudomonadota bacterium]
MKRPIIALDADGVLLDYGAAYPHVWHHAFGVFPNERDPDAYWPIDRWEVDRLKGERLEHFRRHFDEAFWSSMPAVPGAIAATHSLRDAGYELVCVSALDVAFESARLRNLQNLGFPIERVIATSSSEAGGNPKAPALGVLRPVAFVDDYLPYLADLTNSIHTALVRTHAAGSPNNGPNLSAARSHHEDLAAFARWWLEAH